ncbi:MAG: potassium-transporting ATPase subunit KdpC [Gammaproteobacteria bacterium]|nr:potassium-transporting ATPase subunit KdpC [Gammaproteobacteria bacterium]
MKTLLTTVRAFIVFLVLLGVAYPLLVTGIAQMMMPYESNGSLIELNGKIIGSELIGQQFSSERYFHARPSACDYVPLFSRGSNLAPSNHKLITMVNDMVQKVRKENNLTMNINLPADLVTASASGLDPHISLGNAKLQAKRIALLRNIAPAKLHNLIIENTELDFIGIWGSPGVNVLKLNLDLDALSHS